MEKYNIELINKYINGEDIEEYSIEELENDKQFMMLVIGITNDKNFYNLCSDSIKKDYDFVRFIISKFKNDIEFICRVADYFLDDLDDELIRTELIAMMCDLTKGKNEEKYHKYKVLGDTIYRTARVKIEMAKIEVNDEYASDEIGMGFLLIFDSYNSSKIVLDFYAKKVIEAIFDEYDINLENLLHQQFSDPEQINKMGINNYMLSFISAYDSMLVSYLSTNIELLKDFSNKIEKIQENWNKYNDTNEQKKYNLMFIKVNEYLSQVESDCALTETDLLYYIGKELGIAEKIGKYKGINAEYATNIVEELDDELLEDVLCASFKNRIHYNNVKKIMTSILFSNDYEEFFEFSSKNSKGKIIKVDFTSTNKK